MKDSLTVLLCFAAGLLAGILSGDCPAWVGESSLWLLYLLMFLVGIGVGADPQLKGMMRSLCPRDLLYPVATIAGTLAITLIVAPLIRGISIGDSLAINSACGYYSLSSIVIPQMKSAEIGAAAAAELGAVALLANVLRELMALVGAPFIVRRFGPRAEIAAAGVTSVDVCLPVIRRCCGDRYVAAAMLHGTLIDLAVPWMLAALTQS